MPHQRSLAEILSSIEPASRNEIEQVTRRLQEADSHSTEMLAEQLGRDSDPGWQRLLVGTYRHPKTWWIGVIQLQALHSLNQMHSSARRELLEGVVQYNLKYRKADVSGRLLGAVFTNFATMGGLIGIKRLGTATKWSGRGVNLVLASYGAAIKSVRKGFDSKDAILQAILTGKPEQVPKAHRQKRAGRLLDDEGLELVAALEEVITEVSAIAHVSTGPVPVETFCSRPENRHLESICD